MALPAPRSPWPPVAARPALERIRVADAWYSGDPELLSRVYTMRATQHPANRPSQYRGGLVGMVSRWFWGTPTPLGEMRAKLHVPLASDIAVGSSDLLFAETPKIKFGDAGTQKQWETISDKIKWHARLSESAEIDAALGGVYLRAGWDRQLSPYPLVEVLHADAGIPEFKFGMLTAATLWRTWSSDSNSQVIRRHIERHELDGNGNGVILNALYEGSIDNLGKNIGLGADDATRDLEPVVESQIPGLMVTYIPNMLPDRLDRTSKLGRSDYQGAEGMMDSLDETFTSWMRDIRLSKARMFAPRSYLSWNGPGQGASFDLDRELFEAVETLDKGDSGLSLVAQQFAIRVAEHRETCEFWMRRVVEASGYSARTFGMKDDSGAPMTATEVRAEQRKSFTTRQKKINYWSPELTRFVAVLLAIEKTHLSGNATPEEPDIEFPDGIAENPLVLSQTLAALETAQAASTEVKVQMLHPDWEQPEIDEEVKRIHAETGRGMPVEDPSTFRGAE